MKNIPIVDFNDLTDVINNQDIDLVMDRNRPYTGQSHTSNGIRGATEITGITIRDLRDAYIRAVIISHMSYEEGTMIPLEPNYSLRKEAMKGPAAILNENDIYALKGVCDLIAVNKNLSCEIEKLMGIFPNVPGFKKEGYET